MYRTRHESPQPVEKVSNVTGKHVCHCYIRGNAFFHISLLKLTGSGSELREIINAVFFQLTPQYFVGPQKLAEIGNIQLISSLISLWSSCDQFLSCPQIQDLVSEQWRWMKYPVLFLWAFLILNPEMWFSRKILQNMLKFNMRHNQ